MNSLIVVLVAIYGILCFILSFLIIMQGGKAEGLFASAQSNVLGSTTDNILSKITRVLGGIFVFGALFISIVISMQKTASEKALDNIGSEFEQAPITTQDTNANADTNTGANTNANVDTNTDANTSTDDSAFGSDGGASTEISVEDVASDKE